MTSGYEDSTTIVVALKFGVETLCRRSASLQVVVYYFYNNRGSQRNLPSVMEAGPRFDAVTFK